MKIHYLKIREKYLPHIRSGVKKHEYRLASVERLQINVGDILVLISNQNRKDFVKVSVKSKVIYSTWEEAVNKNWSDFINTYSDIHEALHDCYKFYPKCEVDNCGIIVFEIELLNTKYNNSSILLDTNIVIKRESDNNVSYEVANLFNWFGNKSISTYIHAATKNELAKYSNTKSKEVMFAKLDSYNTLPDFKNVDDEYFNFAMSKYSQDENGKIDNILLNEVYNYNVDILLTDDALMLKKAEDLYIRDRVLTSAELLAYFENTYPQNITYKMLAVKLKSFAQVNLNSDFFNSLREDYDGKKFDDWFKNKALQNEQAYVFEDKEELKGFLYLKIEDEQEKYSDINPVLSPKRRLKVGTFKIERTGFRLGERFLKIIFDNAKKYDVEEIYVTLFEDKREGVKQLKTIMEQWGFVKHGYKSNGEAVLIKTLEKYNALINPKRNYPLIKEQSKYYFLPIYPQYHTDLFPDMILKNENMHLYEENKAHRYALEKIYLSGAYNISAKAGDLVLIYRTGERYPKKYSSVVTGIAIIEEILLPKTLEECIAICKNRSIFSEEELRELYPKYSKVIKLLDLVPFKNKVTLNQLYDNDIIANGSGPRPFTELSKDQYEIIYKLGMEE